MLQCHNREGVRTGVGLQEFIARTKSIEPNLARAFYNGALSQCATDTMSSKGLIVAELELVDHTLTNMRRNFRHC